MAENEVLRALQVLKRCGKIDSILFLENIGKSKHGTIYLPEVTYLYEFSTSLRLIISREHYFDIEELTSTEIKQIINQWKMAKLAVAFL